MAAKSFYVTNMLIGNLHWAKRDHVRPLLHQTWWPIHVPELHEAFMHGVSRNWEGVC